MGAQELTHGGRGAGAGALDTTYEPFSREPAYVELNREFVRSLGLGAGIRVVDLACGTGTLTELVLEETRGDRSIVLGVDISRTSLALARRRLFRDGDGPAAPARVRLVAASADRLPVRDTSADVVLMGNAIHYFKDPGPLLDEVHRVLRLGGLFAFNTSFYAGTFLPGTERFYEEWVKEAVKYVLKADAEERRQGRPGIARTRGRGEAPFSRRWPSPAEYSATLERHAFTIAAIRHRTALMTRSSFEAIGAYEGCAAALLSGFPVALASEALARSAAPVLEACGRETVPRQWLEITATRNDAGAAAGETHADA